MQYKADVISLLRPWIIITITNRVLLQLKKEGVGASDRELFIVVLFILGGSGNIKKSDPFSGRYFASKSI